MKIKKRIIRHTDKLILACRNGELSNLEEKVSSTNVNFCDINGKTLLYICLTRGHMKCAELLLARGAELNRGSYTGFRDKGLELPLTTSFKLFAEYGLAPVELIMSYMDEKNDNIDMIFDSIKYDKTNGELLRFVLSKSKNIDLRKYESTIIQYVDIVHLKAIREFEVCIDILDLARFSLYTEKIRCFEFLIDQIRFPERINHKFKISIGSKEKIETLGSICARLGYLRGLKLLGIRGLNIDGFVSKNYLGDDFTLIMDICSVGIIEQGHIKCVEWLIKNNTEIVNIINNKGMTALMLSVKYGHCQLINILIQNGANLYLSDFNGHTVIDYLIKNYPFRKFNRIYESENGLYETAMNEFDVIITDLKNNMNNKKWLQMLQHSLEIIEDLRGNKSKEMMMYISNMIKNEF